jgi:integral membrane protein (TIGR01906 family)
MRTATTIAAGLALALLVVGLALLPLLDPKATELLALRYSRVAESGLSQERVLQVAEQVRHFVAVGEPDVLPATVDGRSGFDSAAISHLRDVRRVIDGARLLTGVLAALVAVWLGLQISRRRFAQVSAALLWGAGLCMGIVLAGVLAGFVDFERLFTWFHGLFFSAGTWLFSADSLLIEVFPGEFWVAAGASWGVLVGVGGALLGGAGWLMRGVSGRS